MSKIEKVKVLSGVYWIDILDANLHILCGCPADSVKHLKRIGLIKTIERFGVSFETGPNAVLLSDVLVQHGNFANLAEFPVLQMLYRQGMIIPNHPNNTGIKPILIGTENQIKSQMQYIFRGNYGLTTVDEMIKSGIDEKTATEYMRIKLKFAFGKIVQSEELLDSCVVKDTNVEIRSNVMIKRLGINNYEISYGDEIVKVDLNLKENESYEPPFELGYHPIKREYFSVIHSGEGDGWDINRPSMASIISFQGSLYLIDAGPNLLHTLNALGISINEIEGIFHTHAHDDHFAGLTTLIRSDHRLKYYATKLVRTSMSKKLCSLMSWNEDKIDRYFEVYDLTFNVWNNIQGLEVMPVFSPHPVETNIFVFRALWDQGYRMYGHYADLLSLDALKKMVTTDKSKPGVSHDFYENVKKSYLMPLNLKKIDIGGGMIHGNALDFQSDLSDKIVMSHTSFQLSIEEKEIGSRAPFGMVDVLIFANQDYTMRHAYQYLRAYFPDTPMEELRILLNCPVTSFNAGSILTKQGMISQDIYLILTGSVEMVRSESQIHRILYVGSLVGEESALKQAPCNETYCAVSYVCSLKITANLYVEFIKRNQLFGYIEQARNNIKFLQKTWLFGEMLTLPVQTGIFKAMKSKSYPANVDIPISVKPELLLLLDGEMQLLGGNKVIETLQYGDFCREESILYNLCTFLKVRTTKASTVLHIPGDILKNIPVVQWKLLETFEKRQKME